MDNKKYDCDVSIIYVNYKNTNLVLNSIKSVREKSFDFSYEIIIVDNSEDENIIKELKNNLDSSINIIDSGENLGFGKANNLGATFAKGKYLFFLNTDTILYNNAILILKEFMDANESCGICGPNLYTLDLKPNVCFSENEMNLKFIKKINSLWFYFKKNILKKNIFYNKTETPLRLYGDVVGAALMIRSSLYNQIGGFEKDIFMYAEETLLCYRVIHETNYQLFNIPSSKIIHLEGASFDGISEFRSKCYVDGYYIYFSKVYGYKEAVRYLKSMKKIFKRKLFLSKIFHKIGNPIGDKCMIDAFDNKIKSILVSKKE